MSILMFSSTGRIKHVFNRSASIRHVISVTKIKTHHKIKTQPHFKIKTRLKIGVAYGTLPDNLSFVLITH